LQNELPGKSSKLVLYAFGVLYLNGYDLRKAPLFEWWQTVCPKLSSL